MFELLKTKCELNPTRKAIADKRLKIKKEAVSKAQISRKDGKSERQVSLHIAFPAIGVKASFKTASSIILTDYRFVLAVVNFVSPLCSL